MISDLHLGGRLQRSVLTPGGEALERLSVAIDTVERVVLLGDAIELIESRPRRALRSAAAVLRALGTAVGPERELILVPGNHDRMLIRPWLRATGRALTTASEVPLGASRELAEVVTLLAPARVRVRYPGVWLADDIWASHGHYLDLHLLPVSTYGVSRGLLRRPARDRALPADYEHGRRAPVELGAGLLPEALLAPAIRLAEIAHAATMPIVRGGLLRPDLAPITSRLLSLQVRRASLPALARVVQRLGVAARWVIFGHVHRLGPLDGEDVAPWQGPSGSPRMLNSGSWVWEPLLVGRGHPPHPYWPGGAVLLGNGAPPRAVGLLDDLDAGALAPAHPGSDSF